MNKKLLPIDNNRAQIKLQSSAKEGAHFYIRNKDKCLALH